MEIEAFCLVAAKITKATSQHEVFKLFQCLCGECTLSDVQHFIPAISSDHLAHVNASSDWSLASHWVQWWTRPSHLKMLNKCFSDMPANRWDKCPATTNAVERKNKDSKGSLRIDLKEALVRVYRIDNAFCLQYIAAEEGVRIRCRDSSHEIQAAAKRKQRCNKQYPKDTEAFHGPPDRESNFGKDKATRKTQTTIKKTETPKRPLNDISNDDNDFQPKKKLKSVSQKPRTDLLFTICKMLYDDGV